MANHTNSLVFAGIAAHPPIMVSEVGRESCFDVQSSISAMAELTERVIQSGAETVVLISPHAPLEAAAFVAYDGPKLHGDFSMFRAADTSVEAPLDAELLNEITLAAEEHNLVTLRVSADLDHGTAVPLYFLQRNGWNGKIVALGYSFLSNEDHLRFGNAIRQAIATLRRPVAFIASGDLSHRLKPGAPAGFDPEAHRFDEAVVDAIQSSQPQRIASIDHGLRRLAGECGYRSMLVGLGVIEDAQTSCEVLSYEGPFGVGYLVAQLVGSPSPRMKVNDQPPATQSGSDFIPALARRTVETFIKTGEVVSPPDPPAHAGGSDLSYRAGCFVSIKTRDGDLRGCIGTIDPVSDSLAEEIIANAISAATRDPRFPPVRADELANLKYSVDVLSAPELCGVGDLDPKTYGVIVEDESGRRGLLLPNLEGIKTAAEQVEIASRKAGIASGKRVKLFRFRADRYSE